MNITGIVGDPGSGKSTLLSKVIEVHRAPNRRIWVAEPYDAVRGVSVGSVDDFLKRDTWPLVARFDDSPLNVLRLALEVGSVTVVAYFGGSSLTDAERRPRRGSGGCHEGCRKSHCEN